MTKPASHPLSAPFTEALPSAIFFRSADMPADAAYPWHSHPWGEFVYSFSGVVEVKLAGQHYLAPPQYGVWLAPHVVHTAQSRLKACHSSIYFSPELCYRMPAQSCALQVGPLLCAMLAHLRAHPPGSPQSVPEERLLQVVLDQLAGARQVGTYLPASSDTLLAQVLRMLHEHPGDTRSLAQLAQAVNSTERTLTRRCQQELGMTFAEWRQRLRVLSAMQLLQQRRSVESIAFELGYASSSAFITMFRRLTDVTPDEYRKQMI